MSQQPKSIPTQMTLPPNMDYYHLRREGIAQAQALSGDLWTDYNEHDPGVTILEQLCYALTELGYKTNYDIEVFLRAHLKEAGKHAFFPAHEIFPAHPTSFMDWRKLILYHVPDVKNAWIVPDNENLYNVRGLYRVQLQLTDVQVEKAAAVRAQVHDLLNAHRNLCEDVSGIEVLAANVLRIEATIVIGATAMGEEVLAQVAHRLQQFVNPSIRRYSLAELQAQSIALHELFDGPPPRQGFILDEDLRPLVTEIYTSRLTKIILGIDGVAAVPTLRVYKDDELVEGDLIQMDERKFPILEVELADSDAPAIQLLQNGQPYEVDYSTTNHIFTTLDSATQSSFAGDTRVPYTFSTPDLPLSAFAEYHSIQHQFPAVYGIGDLGVSPRAEIKRHAQARQLKAYLFVFEQHMANYLLQLSKVQDLFSLDEQLDRSYFFQVMDSIPRCQELVRNPDGLYDDLMRIHQRYDNFEERRAKFIDHLLARFNEYIDTAQLLTIYKTVLPKPHLAKAEQEILNNKLHLLRDYVALGRERGKAWDYTQPLTRDNVAGIVHRLRLLLNLRPVGRSMAAVITDSQLQVLPLEGDAPTAQSINLQEREIHYETIGMSEERLQFFSEQDSILEEVLTQGLFKRNYELYEQEAHFTVLFKFGRNKRLELYQSDSIDACKAMIERTIDYLHQLNKDSEGLHLIEHHLLRPHAKPLYGLRLVDEDNLPLLEQHAFKTIEEQELIAENIDKIGRTVGHYRIEKINGEYWVMLYNPQDERTSKDTLEPIAQSPQAYPTAQAAEQAALRVIDFLTSSYNSGTDILSLVQFPSAEKRPYFVPNAFYSFQVSAVFPRWCNRFKNEGFRQMLTRTLQENLPAHITLYEHWLSYEAMLELETCYFNWAEVLRTAPHNIDLLDTAAYVVSHLLYFFMQPDPALRQAIDDAKAELGW